MWKDEYELGVERIDKQHKELFRIVSELLDTAKSDEHYNKEVVIKTITFLKNYAVQHFHDEEEYQKSINYERLNKHQDIHRKLVSDLLSHERTLIESDFALGDVKNFIGFLSMWLVNHVAGEDQLIVGKKDHHITIETDSLSQAIESGIYKTLHVMAGMNPQNVKKRTEQAKDGQYGILIQSNLHGDQKHKIYYQFSKESALKLFERMTDYNPGILDELVYSAAAEITNIIASNAAAAMLLMGEECTVDPPSILFSQKLQEEDVTIVLDSEFGELAISIK